MVKRVQILLQVEQAQIHAGRVKALFVTHLHGDHCFGIPGLLRSISSAREGTPLATETFKIFGPPGLRSLVTSALAFDATPLCMPLVSLCSSSPVVSPYACCSLLTAVAPHWAMAVSVSEGRHAMSAQSHELFQSIPVTFLHKPSQMLGAEAWHQIRACLGLHKILEQNLLSCSAPAQIQSLPCCRLSQSGP